MLFSSTKGIGDLKHLDSVLNGEVKKLRDSLLNRKLRMKYLAGLMERDRELIPLVDDQIREAQGKLRESNKKMAVLTVNIVGLEQATQPLIVDIQEQKNLYEKVIDIFYYLHFIRFLSVA